MSIPPNPAKGNAGIDPALAVTQDPTDHRPSTPEAAAASQSGELDGQLIGKYRISRKLGSGGMGVVYEAIHQDIGQRVAVKALRSQISTDPEFVQRFFNEARAATIAQHPSLVKVFDYGQLPSGVLYMMMEYLEGTSLATRLVKRHVLPEPEALRLARQIASAMAFVHSKGIVHRDLKPENVFLLSDVEAEDGERVKILDFGLAKIGMGPVASSRSTSVHSVAGTPLYMAPEQCRGLSQAGAAADVYSLGIMLYEMLSGRTPFVGDLPGDLLLLHMSQTPPPLQQLAPGLRPQLADLVHRMLQKAPEQRPSMAEIEDELERLQHSPYSPSVAPSLPDLGTASTAGQLPLPSPIAAPPPQPRGPQPHGPKLRRTLPTTATYVVLGIAAGTAIGIAALRHRRDSARSGQPPAANRPGKTAQIQFAGGRFSMGSTEDESSAAFFYCQQLSSDPCNRSVFEREQPLHEVTLSPFLLDRTEVTNDQFASWLNSRTDIQVDPTYHRLVQAGSTLYADLYPMMGHAGLVHRDGKFAALRGYENRPVNQVTWDAANAYCQAMGRSLPTEAQWEYAAKALQGYRFPWGFDEPRCDGVTLARRKDLACSALTPGPIDVGSSPQDQSAQGVFDLAGNVSEWVMDQFSERYPACPAPCLDPVNREIPTTTESPANDFRVVRGGDWSGLSVFARSTSRSRILRTRTTGSVGFRCAGKP